MISIQKKHNYLVKHLANETILLKFLVTKQFEN